MRVEDQICSLENATKLKELGVNLHSVFCYVNNWVNSKREPIDNGQYIILSEMKHITRYRGQERYVEVDFVSAYTATELGRILPYNLISSEFEYGLVLMQSFPDGKEQDCYISSYIEVYSDLDYGGIVHSSSAKTEADSRAGLLLDLIEKGIVTVEKINAKQNALNGPEIF